VKEWLKSSAGKAGRSKESLPLEKRFALDPQPPVVLELWTKAEALGLSSGTEKEAREFLKIVSDAYVKSDLDKVWAVTEFKNMEYMRALSDQPKSPAEMKKELKKFFEMLKNQKAVFAPIDTAAVRFTLVAEKRVIICRTRDGKDVLVARSGDGGEYVTPLYLARVGGRWVVAR